MMKKDGGPARAVLKVTSAMPTPQTTNTMSAQVVTTVLPTPLIPISTHVQLEPLTMPLYRKMLMPA